MRQALIWDPDLFDLFVGTLWHGSCLRARSWAWWRFLIFSSALCGMVAVCEHGPGHGGGLRGYP